MQNGNKFDYLLPEISKTLSGTYMEILSARKEFREGVDTAPLLNLTVGAFIGSLIHILDTIKKSTVGELKLINNIELTKSTLIKTLEDLPFVSKVEFI